MRSRPESDETLIRRMLPTCNPDRADRAKAWTEWQRQVGEAAVRSFIRARNNTNEPDEDIFQEAIITAYQDVENGRYEKREGIPFTAYVKGIARNKIREAWRRDRRKIPLEWVVSTLPDTPQVQPERLFEKQEKQAYLYSGLAKLSEGRRQVLMRYIRGERTAEIAAALEVSEEVVRQRKSRGLRSLRKMALKHRGSSV